MTDPEVTITPEMFKLLALGVDVDDLTSGVFSEEEIAALLREADERFRPPNI